MVAKANFYNFKQCLQPRPVKVNADGRFELDGYLMSPLRAMSEHDNITAGYPLTSASYGQLFPTEGSNPLFLTGAVRGECLKSRSSIQPSKYSVCELFSFRASIIFLSATSGRLESRDLAGQMNEISIRATLKYWCHHIFNTIVQHNS